MSKKIDTFFKRNVFKSGRAFEVRKIDEEDFKRLGDSVEEYDEEKHKKYVEARETALTNEAFKKQEKDIKKIEKIADKRKDKTEQKTSKEELPKDETKQETEQKTSKEELPKDETKQETEQKTSK